MPRHSGRPHSIHWEVFDGQELSGLSSSVLWVWVALVVMLRLHVLFEMGMKGGQLEA